MKAGLIGKKYTGGFATLEVLISFTVLILCISAVILINFGNQSITINSQINNEAISKARALLEMARADSRFDFNLVNPSENVETNGLLTFTKKLDVIQTDLFTKLATSTVSFQESGKNLETSFSTLLINKEAVDGGDTCSSILTGDWSKPEIENSINFSSIIPEGIYTLTDIDAYKGKLYVTVGKTKNASDSTLFVFNINNPNELSLLGSADNASNVINGLNTISVSKNINTSKIYAYAGSNTASNYSSCEPIDPITHISNHACGQLYIFDVTDSQPIKKANLKIITTPPITGPNTTTSMFYKNGYLFLGLKKNSSGPEFNILDVREPDIIESGTFPTLGSFEIGSQINAVLVRNNYAYIASPNQEELKILNISNINSPTFIRGFSDGAGNGKDIYLVRDKIYFTKTVGVGDDFFILNNNDISPIPKIGGRDLSSSVDGVLVRDYLSFLITGTSSSATELRILRTDDASNIADWNLIPLTLSPDGNETEPSIDCEDNRLYISSNDSTGQGSIYIIKPGT